MMDSLDDIIARMMLEGTEDVPAGAWDNISERIVVKEASRGSSLLLLLRRRYVALATFAGAACAIMLAVLLWPKTGNGLDAGEEIDLATSLTASAKQMIGTVCDEEKATEGGNNTGVENIGEACDDAEDGTHNVVTNRALLAQNFGDKENGATSWDEGATSKDDSTTTWDEGATSKDYSTISWDEGATTARGYRRPISMSASLNTGGNMGRHHMSGIPFHTSYDCGTDGKLTETQGTFYMIPIELGVGIRFRIAKNFSIGTGLQYTFLTRRLQGDYDSGAVETYHSDNITNNQHYLGVPLNFSYSFVNREKFCVYANVGGTIEKCLSNSYSFYIKYNENDLKARYRKNIKEKVGGIQASVNAGVGVQYNFNKNVGIYLDPSLSYYLPNYKQPKSVRTVQPLMFSCELGCRFTI